MSHLNRRGFLKALSSGLAATAALAAVDPEFLLWRPGAKTIFLPPESTIQSVELIDSTTTNVFAVGDIFTIDGYFEYNPKTGKYSRTKLQEFRVLADVYRAAPVYKRA